MNQAWLDAMQLEIQRQALVALLLTLICFAMGMWVFYLVAKAAIRDGIRESGLVASQRSAWTDAVRAASGSDTVPGIPEMRAER